MMMITENAELHRAQRAFRSVLDAFAHPGALCTIERAADNPVRPAALDGALESVVRLFVDQAVTFSVVDAEPDATAAYLTGETHAMRFPVREADFVVVPARADVQLVAEAVLEACRGTLVAPEKGATVLMGCARLATPEQAAAGGEPALHVVEVRGPGVADVNRFAVDRVEWARARAARHDEFPCGVEIVLVDGEGNLVAVPRSSQVTLAGEDASVGEVSMPDRVAAPSEPCLVGEAR